MQRRPSWRRRNTIINSIHYQYRNRMPFLYTGPPPIYDSERKREPKNTIITGLYLSQLAICCNISLFTWQTVARGLSKWWGACDANSMFMFVESLTMNLWVCWLWMVIVLFTHSRNGLTARKFRSCIRVRSNTGFCSVCRFNLFARPLNNCINIIVIEWFWAPLIGRTLIVFLWLHFRIRLIKSNVKFRFNAYNVFDAVTDT